MIQLQSLNKNQRQAVTTDSRYVRIIAGAGSGKTRVLTTRISWLVENRITWPNKILAITFTNKAANEMKDRVRRMLLDQGSEVWISTIHSLCVRILREDIPCMGYPRNFTVLDADDQKAILKEAYKELSLDKQTYSFASMLDYIANNKAAEITVERALMLAGEIEKEKNKAKVYAYYLERQSKLYALDFDDLLLKTVKMFEMFDEVLEKWQKRFTHIHVDEFQDIDNVQYNLIKLLTGVSNSLYVVGDPDQTIYTWRGADVNIIMNFERDFAPLETIVLNENYRSTPEILNGANSVIQYNKYRIEKELFTSNASKEKITHYTSASEEYEARWIASKISELHRQGKDYRDIAVLYRSNYCSRAIEKGLLDEHVPYLIFGGVKFYERAEIKDALCYLRMIEQADDLAFVRIINNPRRGIGNKTLDTILAKAKQENTTMYEIIKKHRLFSGKAQTALDNFVVMVEKWRNQKDQMEVFKLLEMVLDDSGYRRMLEEDKETERLENLKELINDVQSFSVNYPESSLDEYLQLVSLYGDKSEIEMGQAVQLMTIHAAKGLEFDVVFVASMSDGVFPSERAMQEGLRGIEEERRLAYVAMTRAKEKLFLSEATGFSYILGKVRTRSRFIDEIDENLIEHIGATFDTGKPKEVVLNKAMFLDDQPFETHLEKRMKDSYKKGDHVEHGVFGEGVVVKINGGVLEIAFEFPHGVKKIMATHPSIRKKTEENSLYAELVKDVTRKSSATHSSGYKKGQQIVHKSFGKGIILRVSAGVLEIAFNAPHGVKKITENHPSLSPYQEFDDDDLPF